MPARAVASQSLFAPSAAGSKRFLNLHEYQSKDLMEKFGVNVQKGRMASNAADAKEISDWILRDSACTPPPARLPRGSWSSRPFRSMGVAA